MKKYFVLITALCSMLGFYYAKAQGEATIAIQLDFLQGAGNDICTGPELSQDLEYSILLATRDISPNLQPAGQYINYNNYCFTENVYNGSNGIIYRVLSDTFYMNPAYGNLPEMQLKFYVEVWEDDGGDRCNFDTGGGILVDDDDCYEETEFTIALTTRSIIAAQSRPVIHRWDFNDGTYTDGRIGLENYKFIAPPAPLIPDCSHKTVNYSGNDVTVYGVSLEAYTSYQFSEGKIYDTDGQTFITNAGSNYVPGASGVYFWMIDHAQSGTATYYKENSVQLTITTTPSSILGSEGTVKVNLGGDVTFPYSYLLSGNTVQGGSGVSTYNLSIGGLAAGNYTLSITDASGCSKSANIVIPVDSCYYPKQLSFAITNATATGTADGAINLTVSNNALNSPRTYTYLWSTGATTEDLASVAAGIYDVTVTDNHGCVTKARTYVNLPHVNDGPLKLSLRVVQLFARDNYDSGDNPQNTWLVSVKDSNNADGNDWLAPACIIRNIPASGFIEGDGYRSSYSPTPVATMQFGVTTPQFYRLKIAGFEDDCGSRCSYDASCGFLGTQNDDGFCNEEIDINIPFRYQPINQWNDDGWFYTYCGSSTPQYGVRVESKWEYTAVPANTTMDGPIRLEVRADYVKARDYNELTGNAENVWNFDVYDIADLDGSSESSCWVASQPSSSFPYTNPALAIFDRVYPSLVPEKYYLTMRAWENDVAGNCTFEDDGSIFSDEDDAYCSYTTPQFSFRTNPAGVWHLDGANNSMCSGAYGVQYSSRWSYINGDHPANPIPMGVVACDTVRLVSKNTTTVYSQDTASPQPSKDVYYQFELKEPADVVITTCNPATDYDTYLYLTDLSGAVIDENDDSVYAVTLCSRISHDSLPAGIYNIIVEGYSTNEGLFELSVDAVPHPVIAIANLPSVICVGADTLPLIGNPAGGIFSGAGVYQKEVQVTYSVDMTGISVYPAGIKITGNFADLNASANGLPMLNWNWFSAGDSSYYMTDMGNNIWSITVSYPASSIGMEQRYYFVNGDINGAMLESNSYLWDCGVQVEVEVFNRTFVIPNSNTSSLYCFGDCYLCSGEPAEIISSTPEYFFIADNAGVGTHAITYSGINSNGCPATTTQNITVAPLPDASFSGLPDMTCSGEDSIALVPAVAGGSFSGNGTKAAASYFYPSFAANGQNIVTYTIADSNGCQSIMKDTIVVHQPPQLLFEVTNVSQTANGSITLNVTGASPFTYVWSNSAITKDIADLAGGTYTVTVTDSVNCVKIDSAAVASLMIISGSIKTESGNPVPGVTVILSDGTTDTVVTGNDGLYSFSVPTGGNYTITPSKSNDVPTNTGITTSDITRIRRHVLGSAYLDSPYKTIAADASNSSNSNPVTTGDIPPVRRVVLNNTAKFPPSNSRLWEFVSSSHVFAAPAPGEPYSPFPFTKTRSYTDLSDSQANQDFIGVKVGDVSGNWAAPKMGTVGEVQFAMENYQTVSGEEITIPVRVKDFNDIAGYQFTMTWNPEVIQFIEVVNQSIPAYYGEQSISEGMLTTSWNDGTGEAITLNDDAIAFELKFKVTGALGTSTEIKIGSEITVSEAYTDALDLLDITATNGSVKVGDVISSLNTQHSTLNTLQVRPNPFSNVTNIIFTLPQEEHVRIVIYDLLGKAVRTFSGNYGAGEHQLHWNGQDENGNALSKGVYPIRLQTDKNSSAVKAVLTK